MSRWRTIGGWPLTGILLGLAPGVVGYCIVIAARDMSMGRVAILTAMLVGSFAGLGRVIAEATR